MVISHTNGFIFLRIPKNASTSLASFFINNYCNKNLDKWTVVNDDRKGNNNVSEAQLAPYKAQYAFIHMTLQEVVDSGIVTVEQAKEMNCIGVIRDPLERQLSLYFFLNRGKNPDVREFRELFKNGYHPTDGRNKIVQSSYFNVNGEDLSNTWWLYDNLQESVNQFAGNNTSLPTYKTKFTPKDPSLVDQWYNKKTRDAVFKHYEKDFELIESLKNG